MSRKHTTTKVPLYRGIPRKHTTTKVPLYRGIPHKHTTIKAPLCKGGSCEAGGGLLYCHFAGTINQQYNETIPPTRLTPRRLPLLGGKRVRFGLRKSC